MSAHGTNACYESGCRRDECRNAARVYRKKLRDTGVDEPRIPGYHPDVDEVDVECWCTWRVVRVPRRDLLAGFTGPCELDYCKTLDTRRRTSEPAA